MSSAGYDHTVRTPRITLYTRPDCCLCDEAKTVLARVRMEQPFDLEEVDISGDSSLEAQFGEQIPVGFVDGRKAFKYHVDPTDLRRRLTRAAVEPGPA
jgi:glutaredoxin